MPDSKYQFYVMMDGEGKTTTLFVKRIRIAGPDELWYEFPEEFQPLAVHTSLANLSPIKAAKTAMKTRGSHRTVAVLLTSDIEDEYRDEAGNFTYRDHLLAEYEPETRNPATGDQLGNQAMSLGGVVRNESITELVQHFLLEKFSPKNRNVESWCDMFEKESIRLGLSGQRRLEVFKSCLDPCMEVWFAVTQKKLSSAASWSDWREKMLEEFRDDTWRPVYSAFYYRYLSGSYKDYALTKEKMLLELDRPVAEITILDLVITGLPPHIRNSLTRTSVTTMAKLHKKLMKFEAEEDKFSNYNKSNLLKSHTVNSDNVNVKHASTVTSNVKKQSTNFPDKNKSNSKKKPCSICAAKGYHDRFHPEAGCWFRDKPSKSVNNVELTSSAFSMEDDLKN